VPFRISVPNIDAIYHRAMSMELTGAVGFNFQNWMQASQWAARREPNHEDAVAWADAAVGADTGFQTLANKAGPQMQNLEAQIERLEKGENINP
jgi:hypothetical protein